MNSHRRLVTLALFSLLLSRCATVPVAAEPAWVTQPTRTVDAGYIVYVGKGEDRVSENARFKAQSEALSDLANECSFIPKGARIEDQFEKAGGNPARVAFAKVGVTFEECEEAKKAIDPAAVKQLANVAMTEQIKKYQDMIGLKDEETAEASENESAETFATAADPNPTIVVNDTPSFFLIRQRLAWRKQYIILAPAGTFPPGAPQTVQYVNHVTPMAARVHEYEVNNGQVRMITQGWSSYRPQPVHPRADRPPVHPGFRSGPRVAKPHRHRPRKY